MGTGPSAGFCSVAYAAAPEDPNVREELRHFMHFLRDLKEEGVAAEGPADESAYGRKFGALAGAKEGDHWSVTKEVYLKILAKKGYEGAPELVFNFLDQQGTGKLMALDFLVLAAAESTIGRPRQRLTRMDTPKLLESLEARARRRLWVFKLLIRDKYGGSPAQFWQAIGKQRHECLALEEFVLWMGKLEFAGDAEATYSLLDEDCWGKVSLANVTGMMRAASKDGSADGSQRSLSKEPPAGCFSDRSKLAEASFSDRSKNSKDDSDAAAAKESGGRRKSRSKFSGKENEAPNAEAGERRSSKEKAVRLKGKNSA